VIQGHDSPAYFGAALFNASLARVFYPNEHAMSHIFGSTLPSDLAKRRACPFLLKMDWLRIGIVQIREQMTVLLAVYQFLSPVWVETL